MGKPGNVDNWRRAAGMSFQPIVTKTVPNRADTMTQKTDTKLPLDEITFDALYAHLPLTEKQMKLSNDSLSEALYIAW